MANTRPSKAVAMEIDVVVLGRVFVRAESRELAGMVVRIRDIDILFPNGACELRGHEYFYGRLAQHVHEVSEGLSEISA